MRTISFQVLEDNSLGLLSYVLELGLLHFQFVSGRGLRNQESNSSHRSRYGLLQVKPPKKVSGEEMRRIDRIVLCASSQPPGMGGRQPCLPQPVLSSRCLWEIWTLTKNFPQGHSLFNNRPQLTTDEYIRSLEPNGLITTSHNYLGYMLLHKFSPCLKFNS